MKRYAVIVAGGSGSRMKNDIPKQFLKFRGKSILFHTIQRFLAFDASIVLIVVLPAESVHLWEEQKKAAKLPESIIVTEGGSTRSDSVKAGLRLVGENSVVGIHDAVRPILSPQLLKRCYETAEAKGNACPCVAPADSVRLKKDDHTHSINRADLLLVQTPQCFRTELIREAFAKTGDKEFTDEASRFEAAGGIVQIVEGERWNIKITYPEDLLVAEVLSDKN